MGAPAREEQLGQDAPAGSDFLGAVQRVLDSSGSSTEADLLSAAACQFLGRGEAPLEQVAAAVGHIWPGVAPDLEQTSAALELSRQLGLAFRTATGNWSLTATGLEDIQRHSQLVIEMRQRTLADIRRRCAEGLQYEPDSTEANLWLDALVKALIPSIEESLSENIGMVQRLIEGNIAPREVNRDNVLSRLDQVSSRSEIVDFIKSLAASALDPLDPFGKELVSKITTGCVLHSYISGRSGSQITATVGAPVDQRAILDTPVLITLLGPLADQEDTATTIKNAIAGGWNVVVPKHSLEELKDLIEREVPLLQKRVKEAHEKNARIEFYANLVDNQLHSVMITALRDGTYNNLDQLVQRTNELEDFLLQLGVVVREHNNELSYDRRQMCLSALQKQVDRGVRFRSQLVIERDADTLTMAWRRRRREKSGHWPGAWIITSDRAMAPAYMEVSNDPVSITLSLAQWTTVLALSAAPSGLIQLATAAAGQFVDEAMWQLPARFPGDFAMSLAAQLSPMQGGSTLDLRQAQMMMELPEMLDKIEKKASPTEIASSVLSARTRRLDAISKQEIERNQNALAASVLQASDAEKATTEATIKQKDAELASTKLERELEQARLDLSAKDTALVNEKERNRRVVRSILVVLLALTFLGVSVIFGGFISRLVSGVAVAGVSYVCYLWCSDLNRKFPVLIWVALIEVVGLISSIFAFLPNSTS